MYLPKELFWHETLFVAFSAPGNDRFLTAQKFPLLATMSESAVVAVRYRCTDVLESYQDFFSWTTVKFETTLVMSSENLML